MAGDDNEKSPNLSERMKRTLDAARAAAKADRAQKGGRALVAIPLSVGVLLLLLMMPRSTEPCVVPLPRVDARALRAIAAADDARAAAAERTRLSSDILAVGGAIRALNGAEARKADEAQTFDARRQVDAARRDAIGAARDKAAVVEDLISLRALQTRHFLDAVARWEATGDETNDDFVDLAATFIKRSSAAGWVDKRHVLLDDAQRRVAFKTVWNALVGLDERPELAPALDEQRTLYAFYILHPHPGESQRFLLDDALKAATTPQTCATANRDYRRHEELWRAEKIKKLGLLDPSYPTKYALGVVYYRAGRYELASEAFATFIGSNPDGPYALRAKNHLKAALTAGGPL